MRQTSARSAKIPTGRRLQPQARREQIVAAAVELITQQGLAFSTRELARRLTISHPLLFRYFQSKEDILDAVYEGVFLGRYTAELRSMIKEESTDPVKKWSRFYAMYFPKIYDETWIRVFAASAFSNEAISRRYLRNVVEPLVEQLAIDTERHVLGAPSEQPSVRDLSRDLAWMLHSSFFYTGVRRWIFQLPVPKDVGAFVSARVESHFTGAKAALGRRSAPS